jgi:putative oxidoreductase
MATVLNTQNDLRLNVHSPDQSIANAAPILVPVGRILFSLIFVLSGLHHFTSETIGYAASAGVPMASFLVPLSGAIAVLGGLSILVGYKARWGALLLLVFLVPVTLMMHNFWAVSDPMMRNMQMAHFMKNLALMGAAILIFFFGSGPTSLDNRVHQVSGKLTE